MGRMRGWLFPAGLICAALACAGAEREEVLPIPNGGFEQGLEGWRIPAGEGISALSQGRAASGRLSLRVLDNDPQKGSSVAATRVPVQGAGAFELRGKVFPVSGSGLGMYVRVLDRDGTLLSGESHVRGLGGDEKEWRGFALPFFTTEDAAYLELWIHSYNAARVEAYLDDLSFVNVGGVTEPPWEGQYKIKPHETDRLTAADVVGPDGLVYPNWTMTGVQGGIPEVAASARIEDFGARPDDDADDSAALDAACRAVGEKGGGAVLLGEGTYYLDLPVTVRHDGVVIRGRGAGRTRLIFRYALPPEGIAFYTPPAGGRVGPETRLELHCRPAGLVRMHIAVDDAVVGTWSRSQHSGNTFNMAVTGRSVLGKVPDGPHTLRGVGEYADGTRLTCAMPVVLDASHREERPAASSRAAILFDGPGWTGPRLALARDGRRGDTRLALKSVEGLSPGDCIQINGPATERWKVLTKNACRWGIYRRYEMVVEGVSSNEVTVNQPLRIEFPVVDGSYVQKVVPIRRCGVEDLYVEQTEDLWISSVMFSHAWDCWARGVTVRKCGRFPVYGSNAKWCEIRGCVFDDAWFKGGGGTAYTGWEQSWDCLMEDVETFSLRHAPLFQWAASGCVVRRGVFHESDGQWHSGWTNENLFEQCVIESVASHGSYGYGMWASPPEDEAHGPNGPRNVVYNCDVTSPKAGLWMGGMNEGWMILHSRFVVGSGPGVFAKTASFDHTIGGNVFVLRDGVSPMVLLATPDCTGAEIVGNRLYGGNGRFAPGVGRPAVLEGNEALPLGDAPRPAPAVPSIYEWQQRQRGGR